LSQLRDAGLIRVKAAPASGRNRHLLPDLVWRNLASAIASPAAQTAQFLPFAAISPSGRYGRASGLGPKRIKLLYDKFRVRTVDDLRRATKRGRARCIAASTRIAGASCPL